MRKRNVINFTVTGALFSIFTLFTILLMYVDVKPIGPKETCVGFATLNKGVSEVLGVNMALYNITDWFGVVAVLLALGFAILGLVQLIKRKSLKRVDSSILVLGGFYSLIIAAYVFFEINIINYRPVLIQGNLEASYPSSTTMLVICVISTAMMQFNRLIKVKKARITVNTITALFGGLVIVGRLLSGVHWLTDIIGGVLLSSALVMLYYSVNQYIVYKQQH